MESERKNKVTTADGGVPTMTGRQPGGPQPNVQRVAATFRRGQLSNRQRWRGGWWPNGATDGSAPRRTSRQLGGPQPVVRRMTAATWRGIAHQPGDPRPDSRLAWLRYCGILRKLPRVLTNVILSSKARSQLPGNCQLNFSPYTSVMLEQVRMDVGVNQ